MKRVWIVLLILSLVLLEGCYQTSGTGRISNTKFTWSEIRWGGPKNISILPIIAQEKGFFAEEGLETQRENILTGKLTMEKLKNGKIDVGVLVETNIAFSKFQPDLDLRVIAILQEKTDDAIVVRKDRGITNAKDLEGKKLGLTPGTTSHAFAVEYLIDKGVDLEEVEIINMPPPKIKEDLMSGEGELDAGSLWQPFRYNLTGKEKEKGNLLTLDDDEYPVYTAYSLIAVRSDYAKEHKQDLVKFLKALIKAQSYLNRNTNESLSLISEEIEIELEALKVAFREYQNDIHLSRELLESIENEGSWIVEYGYAPVSLGQSVPEYKDVLAPEYLKEIKPEKVKNL